MIHGFGLIPDEPDSRDLLIGSLPLGDAPPSASLIEYALPMLDQDGSSTCVGFSIAQSVWIAQGVAGIAPRLLINPLAVCNDAKRLKLGRDHVLCDLVDRGCSPRYAWQSLRDGIVSAEDYPIDLLKVDNEVPWNARRMAVDRDWLQFFRFDSTGDERCAQVRQAIASGRAPCLGFSLDREFERWAGPWPWQRTGPVIGRHMMCAVGYCPEYLVCVSNWGLGFGMQGLVLIAWPEVAGLGTTDVTVPVIDAGRMP